jgi:hypothetical protein
MVLNTADICEDLGLSLTDIKSFQLNGTMYSSLDEIRQKKEEEWMQSRVKLVDDAAKIHYRTLAFIDELKSEHGNKVDIISFFNELNGIQTSQRAFEQNSKKEEKRTSRESRLKAMSFADHTRRLRKAMPQST